LGEGELKGTCVGKQVLRCMAGPRIFARATPITDAVGTCEIVLDSVPVPILVISNARDKSQCYCFRERFGHEKKRGHVSTIRISFRAVGALQRLVVGPAQLISY
jgi:hypothetical protein